MTSAGAEPALAGGGEVEPVSREQPFDRQGGAAPEIGKRRETIGEAERDLAERAVGRDACRKQRGEHRVAGKAVDAVAVDAELQRLAAIEGDAAELMCGICRKAQGLVQYANSAAGT